MRVSVFLAAVPLLLAACSSTAEPKPVAAASTPPPPAVSISVTPTPGSADADPDDVVTVNAVNGRLTDVLVTNEAGEPVPGALDVDAATWTATGKLSLADTYSVVATGVDAAGATVRKAVEFSTLDIPEEDQLFASTISPLDGSTVGIAQPLVVGFNHPVRNKQLIQDALRVETSVPVEGAWYWIDDQYVDYRPKEFWPENTKITLHADIEGLQAGKNLWGGGSRSISYEIGRAQIIKVDVKRHKLRVVDGKGKTLKSFPVSTGKSGWETRNGIKVLMEKVRDKKWTNEAIDAPEFYRLQSSYAMRMTNSGEFIHDAPWNTGNIGSANTSHGCVGMTVDNARWVYNHAIMGDPIVVTGSPRKYTNLFNRYADWNVPWAKWSAGNAEKPYL